MRNFALWISVTIGLFAPMQFSCGQHVILDTDFLASEGYHNGELQLQSILDGTEGSWLGHSGAAVDTSGSGTVSRTADPRRNLFHKGATGGIAGGNGNSEDLGDGFEIGDRIEIIHDYSFTIDSSAMIGLLRTGIRSNYANGESMPELGLKIDYSNTGAGQLKVFSNLNRDGGESADDPFALVVNAIDVGIDNGSLGGSFDFASDQLRFIWEAEYTALDTWRTTEFSIENLTTLFLSVASLENPTAIEEITIVGAGSEAFFGMQLLQGSSGTGVTDAIQFLYFPTSGEISGDFDTDSDVDGSDLLTWQRNQLPNTELLFWQSNYGAIGNSSDSRAFAVPEARTVVLSMLAIMIHCQQRKRSSMPLIYSST